MLATVAVATACTADDLGMPAGETDDSGDDTFPTTSFTGASDSESEGMGPSYGSFRPAEFDMEAAERIIVLGDSVGQGEGATEPDLTFVNLLVENDDERWPDESGFDLKTYLGELPKVVNAAVGGATSEAVVQAQLPEIEKRLDLPASGHTIVIITVGGNDLIAWLVSPQGTEEEIVGSIVANTRTAMDFFDAQRFPDGVSFIINTVYDPSDGTGTAGACYKYERSPEVFHTLRDELVALGMHRGAAVSDTLSHFDGHGINASSDEIWFSDCVHPNNRGHHELRRMFFELVDPSHPVAP